MQLWLKTMVSAINRCMDPREVAYYAYERADQDESNRNASERLRKMAANKIDWTIEEVVESIRTLAKADHDDPEVLAWIDAYVDYHGDLLRRMTELYEE